MRNFFIILKKELYRVFTDKKLVFNAFILPPLMLIIIYTILGNQMDNFINDIDTHTSDVYIQQAPKEYLNYINDIENVNIHEIDKNKNTSHIKDEIFDGEVELLIVFEDDFMMKVRDYKQSGYIPEIKTYYNPGEEYSQSAYSKFIGTLDMFENTIISQRLEKPEYLNAFDIDRNNSDKFIVNEKKATGKGLGMLLPMLLIMFLFTGGMAVGIDMVAGEKERGTMATLLVTPTKRHEIALGKTVSLGIISIASAFCYFGAMLITLKTAPQILTGSTSFAVNTIHYGLTEFTMLLITMISVVCIFVGIICLLSVISKNIKEAGTLITPAMIVVMISAFLNMFSTKTPEIWQFAIPVYGTTIAIKSILAFEMTWTNIAIVCGSSLIITAILITIIAKMFNSERVMFSK